MGRPSKFGGRQRKTGPPAENQKKYRAQSLNSADSGWNGNQFSGGRVAGQSVAGRVAGRGWEAVSRLGTGVPVRRQRWTAAAGSESRWAAAQRSS